MRTDRELLELAAKAAGIGGGWDWPRGASKPCCYRGSDGRMWSPLTDDGDALRLAVSLGICIEFTDCADNSPVIYAGLAHDRRDWPMRACFPDPGKETRRAIVLASAEIGASMP